MVGWIVSVLVSVGGMLASYHFDLPTGATVVTTFGLALALAMAWRGVAGSRSVALKPEERSVA